MNLSDRGHLEPKLLVCSVMFSLVWESKDGFSISAFTNTQMWFFTCSNRQESACRANLCSMRCHGNPTWKGLTVTPALFFFFTTSISLATIWSTT